MAGVFSAALLGPASLSHSDFLLSILAQFMSATDSAYSGKHGEDDPRFKSGAPRD